MLGVASGDDVADGPLLHLRVWVWQSHSWRCQGPLVDLGMTGIHALLDPYPPQGLLLGVQDFLARTPGEHASILRRVISGQSDRCLVFRHPAGAPQSVCLASSGLIASYHLPTTESFGPMSVFVSTYSSATLVTVSSTVPAGALSPPSRPHPVPLVTPDAPLSKQR